MRIVIAFFSAAFFPALLMSVWSLYGLFMDFGVGDEYVWVRAGSYFTLYLVVSLGYVFLLGAPAYYLLGRFKLIRWWSTIGTGFILGAFPMAVFIWPLKYSELRGSASVNGVKTMINGVPTMEGWLQFVSIVSFFGACGMVGALAFWLVSADKFRRLDVKNPNRFQNRKIRLF